MGLKEDKSPGPDNIHSALLSEKLCKNCSPSSNNHVLEIIFRRYPSR